MTLTDQKKQALDLYVNQSFTQQQIADSVGVCVRTIHNWVKQHAWDRLRLATHQAPALIADNFSSQLVELQNNIASREPGNRYPTTQEMEIMRKLTVCIANTKKTVSLPQVTQMMRMFRSFVFDNRSKPYAQGVADVIDAFLEARSRFGYSPYELEFGVEKIQHIDPLYNPYVDTIAKETTEPVFSRFFDPEESNQEPNPKIHTVDTSKWSEEMISMLKSHLGDQDQLKNMPAEEQATYASIAQKLKPILENETPLIINDLHPKTPETIGNESANPATHIHSPQAINNPTKTTTNHLNTHSENSTIQDMPVHTNTPIPENETPLIINELSAKTPETTGKKPENPIDPQYAGYPTSSTPPDPTVPYTYYSAKMLITKYPDGRIRYDYGGGRPAVTIKKGGPAILERRVFYI
jgi:hypothetical protein